MQEQFKVVDLSPSPSHFRDHEVTTEEVQNVSKAKSYIKVILSHIRLRLRILELAILYPFWAPAEDP